MCRARRSVNFNKDTGDCYLNDVDRFTVSGRPAVNDRPAAIDYMESNCAVDEPKMCDFAEVAGKLLKTVDAIYEHVATMDRCKELCLAAREFRCHSFDYNETGVNVCRISHHSMSSLSQLDRPYMAVAGATTYQMSSCFGVKIDCRGTDMVASIHTNRLFDGKVYAKNRPNSCVNDVRNTLDFELHLDYHNVNCDVRQDYPGKFFTEIIIQVSVDNSGKTPTPKYIGFNSSRRYYCSVKQNYSHHISYRFVFVKKKLNILLFDTYLLPKN